MKKKEKIAIAVIAGLAVSAAAVYLFTSEKGNEIRKKAVKRGKELLDELELIKQMNCKEQAKEAVA